MNICMWSGPRNLSTAMMYAFSSRADCAVWDEPFYAAYLAHTGLQHPMTSEILAAHEPDPEVVAQACAGDAPDGSAIFYQKHMAHHMLPEFGRDWMGEVRHVFLLRHPARVLASYHVKHQEPRLEDIGAVLLTEIFEEVSAASEESPVVIDSADIRLAPREMLEKLCDALGIAFDPAMLEWSPGGNPADGVWARHWYNAVHASRTFSSAEGPLPDLPPSLQPVLAEALPHYEALKEKALQVDPTNHASD